MGTIVKPIASVAEHAFVINLAHRTDRWEHVQKELDRIGYSCYERFDAYGVNNHPPERYYKDIPGFEMSGWYGNKFSHYGVIDTAKQRGYSSVAVFEDDVIFHPLFDTIAGSATGDLGALDWDWLQFGGNHRYFGGGYNHHGGLRNVVAPNIAKITKMLTAHAFIVKSKVYDFILDNAIKSPLSIDGFYAHEVHTRFNCYCLIPCAARQIQGPSDIGGGLSDNSWYIGD